MTMRSVEQLELSGKRTLVRVDFNVPLRDGVITDDTRIQAALPTIRHLQGVGAKIVLMSHLGRPKGEPDDAFTLEPVAARLAELLDGEVYFTDDCIGPGVRKVVSELPEGGVLLLENVRFHDGEKKNDPVFAERLAKSGDVFINDAFGALHRAHASTVGVASLLDERCMGLLVQLELRALRKLVDKPGKPFVAVLGGAKVSDKISVFENLMQRVNGFVVGGAMAFTFLAAKGHGVGTSLVERDKIWQAKKIMARAEEYGVALHLPTDFVVRESPTSTDPIETVSQIPDGKMGLDIGPDSVARFSDVLESARTVLWNGPMGMFEVKPFDAGTRGVAEAVGNADAYTVVGGGDSVAAVKQMELANRIGHVSTGGGASLEFLSGTDLPGLVALRS